MSFLEVTEVESNQSVLINVGHIIDIWKSNEYCGILTTGMKCYVKESYEELRQMLLGGDGNG